MTDCDFALIKQYQQKGHEVYYFIQLVMGRTCGGLLNLKSKPLKLGIEKADAYPEFQRYADYIDLTHIYLVNRTPKLLKLKNIYTYFHLRCMIKKFTPDVVHINDPLGFAELQLFQFIPKMVITVHDPFMHSGEGNLLSDMKRWFTFKMVKKHILLNENQKEGFIKHYNLHNKQLCVGRLGVYDALNIFMRDEDASVPIGKYGKYILFFGHISPYKGIDVLCQAMSFVHEQCPDLHCVIAGRGKYYFDTTVYEQLPYLHFENRFIETSELAILINYSIFSVCPYKDATQSGVVASSFALAKPVLATNVGGLCESVNDSITGRLVAPNNVQQLASVIIDMVNNPMQVKVYTEHIKRIFGEGENSWSTIAYKYLKFYEQ